MKVLITGFNPFANDTVNPSYEAVKKLPDEIYVNDQLGAVTVIKVEIPTEFDTSARVVRDLVDLYKPTHVICVGQAGGRSGVTPERVAINLDDASIPDNAGYQPVDKPIINKGENAYFASLPVKGMVEEMNKSGIPAGVSHSAGTFVCNHIMYHVCHMKESGEFPFLESSGFIHVPFCPDQVERDYPWWKPIRWLYRPPSMSLEDMSAALAIAIKEVVKGESGDKIKGGAIC
ncbi:Pyrrolidone-carboxylate peptidase [Yarrowia sp. C11]|nr:Pyrrolidone-carboxylate peptidase [Yarrowia sp. E02]KAG5371421.1 Pyrrolidone-carboxylate peptidase [Yarrowia sp. C11]